MEDTSVKAEETATDSQSEEQTDVDTSSEETTEDTQEDTETTDESSEETENTEETTAEPKSKANERIRDLIKKLRDKDVEIKRLTQNQPKIEGVTDDGEVEVDKLFNSAVEKAKNDLAQANTSKEITEAKKTLAKQATIDFEFMKEEIWQEEAMTYVAKGYDPYTAAEMVEKKINYLKGQTGKDIAKQVKADKTLKNNSYTPTGTKPNTTSGFSREEIDAMSTKEYEKNKSKILKQYGIKANL
jgi:hypothetical protein